MTVTPSDRLIVALDLPDVVQARALVDALGDSVSFYKIGLELGYSGKGFAFSAELIERGKKIFFDLKLHDIPNTVERATAQIARRGVEFLTVHAFPQTMSAAKKGAAGSGLKLLAVTVLTSYDDDDLEAAGYRYQVRDLVPHRAQQAVALGMDGLVAAASEAAELRRTLGPHVLIVTPGIRLAGGEAGDQKRIATPAAAIAAGADYLVVGRPITAAAEPRAAAEAIQHEIAAARG